MTGEVMYLGVDVGGSKTHAVICAQEGQILGLGTGPCGNWEDVGEDGFVSAMRIAINEAKLNCSNTIPGSLRFSAAGFGIAGYDWDGDRVLIERGIRRLELGCPFHADNDAMLALWAGSSQGWGIAVMAGTGNNVRGRSKSGKTGRITGHSVSLGEYGGASELVFLTQQRLAKIWIGRSGSSALVERLVNLTGAAGLTDLVEGLVRYRYRLTASAAPLIIQTAEEGDPAALELLRFNARELCESVVTVARQLGLLAAPFEMVMGGSMLTKSAFYRDMFLGFMRQELPAAQPVLLEVPAVMGGIAMAKELLSS